LDRAENPSSAVHIAGVRRAYAGGAVVFDEFSLDVAAGEFLAILGPSGCGKSTLLRMIAGLDQPQAGTISAAARDHIAYVFQDAHLLPWRSVLANVALPLEFNGISRNERLDRAKRALDMVGLSEAIHQYPNQLSGGMRMRVSLARAMVTQPRLLLLDEPFAALDEITRQHLDEQLYELWQRTKLTVLFVTHSTNEAVFLANRAVVLSRRPARIVLDTAIELPADRPASIRGSAIFAEQTRAIYQALEHREAS
jgi:NitT/TauT family transport system ATP-binding protein